MLGHLQYKLIPHSDTIFKKKFYTSIYTLRHLVCGLNNYLTFFSTKEAGPGSLSWKTWGWNSHLLSKITNRKSILSSLFLHSLG